jgi:metal-responsive CopG/Arc/MetJ family transcriptional regulator
MAKAKHGGKREGAGRPADNPEGKTMLVAVTVPEVLVASLDALAAEKGWNRSRAATEAIRRLVKAKRKA